MELKPDDTVRMATWPEVEKMGFTESTINKTFVKNYGGRKYKIKDIRCGCVFLDTDTGANVSRDHTCILRKVNNLDISENLFQM